MILVFFLFILVVMILVFFLFILVVMILALLVVSVLLAFLVVVLVPMPSFAMVSVEILNEGNAVPAIVEFGFDTEEKLVPVPAHARATISELRA